MNNADDWKEVNFETSDGAVWDEADLTMMTIDQVKSFGNCKFRRSIHCRYFNAKIPASFPIILTTNRHSSALLPSFQSQANEMAIVSRFIFHHITTPLWNNYVSLNGR